MDKQKLEYFLTICECKSFSQAGERLYISQQGISKFVSKLEKELGIPLFYRNKSGVRLTREGQLFQNYANDLLKRNQQFLQDLKALQKQKTKPALAVTAGAFFIFEKLRELESDFELIETNDYSCEEMVLNQEAAWGITSAPVDLTRFDGCHLIQIPLFLVCDTGHPFAHKKHISYTELQNQRVMLIHCRYKINRQFRDFLKTSHIACQTIYEAENIINLYKHCSHSDILGISTKFPNSILNNYHVTCIPLQIPLKWELYLIKCKNRTSIPNDDKSMEKIKTLFS